MHRYSKIGSHGYSISQKCSSGQPVAQEIALDPEINQEVWASWSDRRVDCSFTPYRRNDELRVNRTFEHPAGNYGKNAVFHPAGNHGEIMELRLCFSCDRPYETLQNNCCDICERFFCLDHFERHVCNVLPRSENLGAPGILPDQDTSGWQLSPEGGILYGPFRKNEEIDDTPGTSHDSRPCFSSDSPHETLQSKCCDFCKHSYCRDHFQDHECNVERYAWIMPPSPGEEEEQDEEGSDLQSNETDGDEERSEDVDSDLQSDETDGDDSGRDEERSEDMDSDLQSDETDGDDSGWDEDLN